MRVWERGNGETRACGTGACAAVVAATENGLCPKGEPITVKVSGGVHPVVPVKSAKAVPKDKVKDCVKEIGTLEIKAPVKIGDVVCANILGTGVDIVATNICPEA